MSTSKRPVKLYYSTADAFNMVRYLPMELSIDCIDAIELCNYESPPDLGRPEFPDR